MPPRQNQERGRPQLVSAKQADGTKIDVPEPGSIKWLPPEDEAPDTPGLESGRYNHPVVILSTNSTATLATALLLTTFSDQNHATKYPDNKARRMGYLPIVPSPAHPDNGILLHLEDGQELRRASYVNTKNHHTVAIRSLRPYYRNQYRPKRKLTDPSFLTLTTYMSYTPSAPCTPLAPLSAELHRPSLPHAPQPAHRSSKPIPTAPIPRRPAVRPLCQLDNYVSSGAERPTPAVTSRRCNAGEELPLFHSTSTYGTFGTPPPPSTPEQPGISGVALLCLLLLLTIAALAGLGYGTYRVLVCAIDLLKRCWDMVRDGHWPFARP